MPDYSLLIISVSSPLKIGIYRDTQLVETVESDLKSSEILLKLLYELLQKYTVFRIIYTRGPGSFMAIKLTYVTLKTIEIVTGIKCVGCSAFALNGGGPIKAVGNLYFLKEKETIMTQKLEQPVLSEFSLPQSIQDLPLDEESTPKYMIPAV